VGRLEFFSTGKPKTPFCLGPIVHSTHNGDVFFLSSVCTFSKATKMFEVNIYIQKGLSGLH
jgi:hypothetical protein